MFRWPYHITDRLKPVPAECRDWLTDRWYRCDAWTLTVSSVVVSFVASVGFIVYLVFEIWRMKQKPGRVLMNGIGIYIAYMGVFVEILQIVISMLAEE